MNIQESFVQYLETISDAVLGTNLFIGQAPSNNKVPDTIYWLIASGGSIVSNTATGEAMKAYSIEIYYRSRNYKQVYDLLQELEITLNCSRCIELEDFVVIQARATTFPIDNDLDSADRKVGLVQVDLTVYEDCQDVS